MNMLSNSCKKTCMGDISIKINIACQLFCKELITVRGVCVDLEL